MRLHISRCNMKLGNIPSLSLPPLVSCVENPPCAKDCYARKVYTGYGINSAKPAWDENWKLWNIDPTGFRKQLFDFLEKSRNPYFRWHVSGDIPSMEYYAMMRKTALAFPEKHFLAFTRSMYGAADPERPTNLNFIRSVWITESIKPANQWLPIFKALDAGEKPEGFYCPGSCATCKACWTAKAGDITYIYKH